MSLKNVISLKTKVLDLLNGLTSVTVYPRKTKATQKSLKVALILK